MLNGRPIITQACLENLSFGLGTLATITSLSCLIRYTTAERADHKWLVAGILTGATAMSFYFSILAHTCSPRLSKFLVAVGSLGLAASTGYTFFSPELKSYPTDISGLPSFSRS